MLICQKTSGCMKLDGHGGQCSYGSFMQLPPVTGRPGPWMSQWLEAFLESNADDLAEKDAIVLDQIREHLQEGES